MKPFKFFITITFLIFLFSCSDTYNEYEKIEGMQWFKKDVKTFEVNISEDGEYDLFFTMRYSYGYPFTTIEVDISQETPDGKLFVKNVEFPIINKEGKYIGDVTGQLWDIENLFAEKIFMKKGKYIFKISPAMNLNPVVLVIDVGIIVRKVKK